MLKERVKTMESPYYNSLEAAKYLNMTVQVLYQMVYRGRLKKLPGLHQYRFTKDMLDKFLTTPRPRTVKGK